jgi:hypothetical protein
MPHADPPLPSVFTAAEARAKGMTESQIQRRQRSRWQVLRRGVYCLRPVWESADRQARHRLAARAALKSLGDEHVVSHASAAVFHGLPQPRADDRVWLTAKPGGSCRYLGDLVVERASVPAGDRWVIDGLPVTSLARTVADCLRHLPAVDAVAIADAAVRKQPGLAPFVGAVLERCERWPFVARAMSRLPMVDGRRESHIESWSYVLMHEREIPLPEPQVVIRDENGIFVARVDGLWRKRQLVGEVDGLVKYGFGFSGTAAMGDDGAALSVDHAHQVLVDEKRREERLRDLGLEVVRWGSKDLKNPGRWEAMLRARLAEPPRRDLRARFSSTPRLTLVDDSGSASHLAHQTVGSDHLEPTVQ